MVSPAWLRGEPGWGRASEVGVVASGPPGSGPPPDTQEHPLLVPGRGHATCSEGTLPDPTFPASAFLTERPAAPACPVRLRVHLPESRREVCVRRSSPGARGSVPSEKPGPAERGVPKPRLGDRKPSPHPASSPHRRYQAQKPRKGELGLFLFCSQPLPVSPSSGQLRGSPHPAPSPTPTPTPDAVLAQGSPPTPGLPHLHLGCGGPSPWPVHGALGHADGPSHAHSAPPPGESPARAARTARSPLPAAR